MRGTFLRIISKQLSRNLQKAKGMRNVLAHQYGNINDTIIFNALSEEIERDIGEFVDKLGDIYGY